MRKVFKRSRDQNSTYCGYPSMKTYGMILMDKTQDLEQKEPKLVGYYVMKRCQITLDEYVSELSFMEPTEVFQISIEMLDTLEILHETGRTYNDLKLNNIMIDKNPDGIRMTLIDYGFAESYRNKAGEHVAPETSVETFQGNLLFASGNQMDFFKTSRRDDLISLSYIMLFLLNQFEIPGFP